MSNIQIGSICGFDLSRCEPCPIGTTSSGRNLNSCGTCVANQTGLTMGFYASSDTSPESVVIFDREKAKQFVSTITVPLNRDFDNTWWSTDTDTVFVRISGYILGFFSYSVIGNDIILSRTRNSRLEGTSSIIYTLQGTTLKLTLQSDGTLKFNNQITLNLDNTRYI